jgi:hypothetical protein
MDLVVLRRLLDRGADVNTSVLGEEDEVVGMGLVPASYYTLLHLACMAGDGQAIRYLITRGALNPGAAMAALTTTRVNRARRMTGAQRAECMQLLRPSTPVPDLEAALRNVMHNNELDDRHLSVLLNGEGEVLTFSLLRVLSPQVSDIKVASLAGLDGLRPTPSITAENVEMADAEGRLAPAALEILNQELVHRRAWSRIRAVWIRMVTA